MNTNYRRVRTLLVALLACAGCVHRPNPADPFLSVNANYVDLEAGWRLRVVTPILRSGGYRLRGPEQRVGNTITMSAGDDFIGYEVAYYSIQSRWASGLRIKFGSATTVVDGKTSTQHRPVVNLFHASRSYRYLRMVSLTRSVNADHNQSLLAADDRASIAAMTDQINNHPEARCDVENSRLCVWVPQGISVQPEVWRKVDGVGQWTPAR